MARQSKGRQLKKIIYIFTEGCTETNYFSMLNRKYNSTNNVRVSVKNAGKQGESLLSHALGELRAMSKKEKCNLGGIYIIFDKDDLNVSEIQKVLCEARNSNIEVGYSNSCFDIWLLAHFELLNHSHTKETVYELLEQKLDCSQYAKRHKNDPELLKRLEDKVCVALDNTKSFPSLNQTQIKLEPYTNIGEIVQKVYNREFY